MSFKDELNANLKTPQQVAQEKESAEVAEAKRNAQYDFEMIKNALKQQVSQGQYYDSGSYKQVSATIISSNLLGYCQRTVRQAQEKRGFFGNDIHFYAIFTVSYKNDYIAREYFKELDKLTKAEGITYEAIAKHERVCFNDTFFSIPGSCRIECFDNSVRNISVGLRASMKF